MVKFAHYTLRFINGNDLFATQAWPGRQKAFGELSARDDSIDFTQGNDSCLKTHIHQVYHLSLNENIIVMRIAPNKQKEVVQNFKGKYG